MSASALGGVALRLAVVSALLTLLSAAAAAAGSAFHARWSRRGAAVLLICTSLALASLLWALGTGDFELAYVADATSRAASWPYRLAGAWAGMGGSLLFWSWLLTVEVAVFGAVATKRQPDLATPAVGVLVALAAAFLATTAALADPFRRLDVPAIDGGGLTPILEHPAMLYHPPLLYAGLVGCAVPGALAAAGLFVSRLEPSRDPTSWLALLRRGAAVAWLLLTLGLLAGAHWAYVELGWGGYWAWDPVENAGLLPWLGLTALLHAARGCGRDGSGGRRVAGLGLATLVLALLGTLLTRSGAATSVHAFAEEPQVGRALLALVVAVAATAVLLVVRHPAPVEAPRWTPLSVNNLVLLGVAVVVAWGTLFPLASELLGGDRVVVSGRFFALFTAPLALAGVALLGRDAVRPHRRLVAMAGLAVGLLALWSAGSRSPWALAVGGVGGAALTTVLATLGRSPALRTRRRLGSVLAHVGIIVLLMAVAGSTGGVTTTASLDPGDGVEVGSYVLRHDGLTVVANDDHRLVRVSLAIADGHGEEVGVLRPGQRVYPDRGELLAETALRSTPVNDLQVALRRVDGTRVVVETHLRPLVWWLWWGGLLVAAGGALTLLDGTARRGAARCGRKADAIAEESRSPVDS